MPSHIFDFHSKLIAALSSEPFPVEQIPVCPIKNPIPDGGVVICSLSEEHPELVRLLCLHDEMATLHDELDDLVSGRGRASDSVQRKLAALKAGCEAIMKIAESISASRWGVTLSAAMFADWKLALVPNQVKTGFFTGFASAASELFKKFF